MNHAETFIPSHEEILYKLGKKKEESKTMTASEDKNEEKKKRTFEEVCV